VRGEDARDFAFNKRKRPAPNRVALRAVLVNSWPVQFLNAFRSGRRSAAIAGMALMLGGIAQGATPETDPRLLRLLGKRKLAQIESIKEFSAFHDFQFTDKVKTSGITFEHHIVEDAGKNWQAAHYDHGNGLAVADVDGDGRLDLYFVSQLGSCALYRNLGGGKFEDITEKAGVALTDQIGVAASFADVDNDGDPDLFVTTVRHGNHLFENLGGGRFRDVTKESGLEYSGHSSASVFFDYDRDGLLDLFVCNVGVYTEPERIGPGGFYRALTNAFQGHLFPERTEFSLLYHNEGGRKFKEVSRELNLRDGYWTGEAIVCDVNADGWPDLYVVNMQGDDHLYENDGGKRFVENTARYFPKTPWGAMGVKFFDFNNDGRLDLFVTDMHSDMTDAQKAAAFNFSLATEKSKSERWCMATWSDAFLQGASNNLFGNAFYVNKGGGQFEEMSDALGLETYWPWGPSVGDLNADGYEDVFIAAGMGHPFRYGNNTVALNEGGRRFFDAEFALGVEPRANGRCEKVCFTLDCDGADKGHQDCAGHTGILPVMAPLSTRSAAILDFDDDGDLDILTAEFNDRPQVLVSDLSARRQIHWLKVRLVGTVSNRDAVGALVRVHAGGKVFTRYQDGKSGYLSQSVMPLYYGLGDATTIEKIEVTWPNGMKETVTRGLAINRLLTLNEAAD
jgi:hypothetical protein